MTDIVDKIDAELDEAEWAERARVNDMDFIPRTPDQVREFLFEGEALTRLGTRHSPEETMSNAVQIVFDVDQQRALERIQAMMDEMRQASIDMQRAYLTPQAYVDRGIVATPTPGNGLTSQT